MNKKHVFIMMTCCLLPIAGLALSFLFNVPVSTVIFGALILICPLSMFLMMMFMGREHDPTHPTDRSETVIKDAAHAHNEGQ